MGTVLSTMCHKSCCHIPVSDCSVFAIRRQECHALHTWLITSCIPPAHVFLFCRTSVLFCDTASRSYAHARNYSYRDAVDTHHPPPPQHLSSLSASGLLPHSAHRIWKGSYCRHHGCSAGGGCSMVLDLQGLEPYPLDRIPHALAVKLPSWARQEDQQSRSSQ